MRSSLFLAGLALVLMGFALIAVGSAGQPNASTGGFVLIGPIPIVFGTGGNGGQLALLSIFAGVILLVMVALWARVLLSSKNAER